MKEARLIRLKNTLIPIVISALIGVLTGCLIFLFKIASSHAMHFSADVYSFVRENPIYLPVVIVAAASLGALSALILKHAKECRGGGIPAAIASIRGLIPLKWVQGLFVLFFSATVTYVAGVPLGNEGPSVQMGTAVGKGASTLLGEKKRAWERYTMTGGASAGFAIATGAPLSGIMFALEEAHRRFTPAIIMVASVSVLSGTITQEALGRAFGVDTTFFDLSINEVLPARLLWVPILIGVACGLASILFTYVYNFVRRLERTTLRKIPFTAKIVTIFSITAVAGFISEDFIGSGHDLIEKILHGGSVWYLILIAFIIRSLIMIFANGHGVTGGLFVPTLAFGAMIAALVAEVFLALGVVDEQYFPLLVVVGMASFFSSSSRTPLTALAFAAEALCLASNILPTAIGVVVAYLIGELSGKLSFTDTVIESRTESSHHGITPIVVDTHMTVRRGAFAVGMEIRDILWPPTCVVLSVEKHSFDPVHATAICEGDVLHVHYQTYYPSDTLEILESILGTQDEDKEARIHPADKNHVVPLE